jgi:hypothetical protein
MAIFFIIIALIAVTMMISYELHPQEKATARVIGNAPVEKTGQVCNTDADCHTPGRYLLRSDCPYESRCIGSECVVVCPKF